MKSNGNRWTPVAALIVFLVAALAGAGAARAALDVSQFSVAPSTTQAGGHPSLRVSVVFTGPSTGLKDIALHLPGGLTASSGAAPFCSRKRLRADLCSPRSSVGSLTVAGLAFGFEVAVSRRIYNLRPAPSERLRLGVSIYGTASEPGVVAELPVTERPQDKGLDMAVTGLPSNVNGIDVRVARVDFRFKGVVRKKVRRKWRKRSFITNPRLCVPATSILEVTSHDAPAAKIVRTSAFTPTGCG